ncbi:putative quinol monooxygenase [Microbulbifer halophilus]|uniref:Quinol monooxygenase n=1 Tax=Microbulbifer halophilus TaxID=453963 RepID=A0ABW5EBM0_9GAMM|nr:putative quinol monooxygenase [Microbulbifer halophilus]MCW8125841.1 putative quinol monooxygenase [Microbulbifer halophilus]
MEKTLTLVAFIRAKQGLEDELGRRLQALIAPTRQEAGCINYDLHRSNDDPALWMLHENWRSQRDLDQHFETPYLKDFLDRAGELLAEEMDLRFFSPVSAPAL